jgi:3-oxoacyl-(acyl-carrier-protein) synthase
MRRVVITGMGALSALGLTVQSCFDNLIAGHSGIRPHPTHALPVPVGYVDFDAGAHFSKMQLLGLDRVSQLAIVAAEQAMQQAQAAEAKLDRLQMGVFWGTGGGGCESTEHAYAKFFDAGGEQKKLLTVPAAMIHAAAAQVAMRFGIGGECQTYSTACSSAAVAIGEAFRRIQYGHWPMALAGGAEAPLVPGVMNSWMAMRVLCTDPQNAPGTGCRPFSADRCGFAMAEGAAAFVLEDLEYAQVRGANILAEMLSYGVSNDAAHITKPDAKGQARAMQSALSSANLAPQDIGYINAHGTATHAGDMAEVQSIEQVFGSVAGGIPVSATKSAHGHALGAGGALEWAITIEALRRRVLPPTTHFTHADTGVSMDFIPHSARLAPSLQCAMSNSFAFGGNNAVLIARRWESA